MKFSELLEKGEGIARRAVKGGAMLAETGIFEGIPIVGNILNGAAMINEVINGSDDCEGALAELRDTVLLIEPVISQLAEAEHLLHNSEHAQSLHNNLEAVSKTLEDIWDAVQLYVNKNVVIKLATSGSNEQSFIDLLSALKKGLDNLNFMISGETLIAMLNTKAAVDNLAEHLKKLEATKNAQDARKEGEEQMEIDERLVEWIEVDENTGEPRPFATGTFGSVFRVKYEGEIVCAKLMDLKGYTTKQLNAT
ncbi:hypothetical protein TrST_g2574 [Triparma strigata]|uniref:Uncharacterized protein n=1 Tax=Triparma strigata TaxID=1606541 RepID=A0A9W7BUF7_9STRA|nr:hypothetical protein TrST_g2574 [Triparma strigata]